MDADPRDQRIKELEAEKEGLRTLIKLLQERIEELERAAARKSAPFRRKDKERKPPGQREKPGRKQGHPPGQPRGATRG